MKQLGCIGLTIKKLNESLLKKVYIYFSSKTGGSAYDPYEANYVQTNLNPVVLKVILRELSPETAFWKQYGLAETKIVEIITEERNENYFRYANRIVIDGEDYEVFKSGTGSQVSILKRPMDGLRVTLSKKA